MASLAYIGLRVMILACIFISIHKISANKILLFHLDINHTISRFESEMLNYNIDAEQMENRRVIVKLHKVFMYAVLNCISRSNFLLDYLSFR